MLDNVTFKTDCGEFFRSKFVKIKGYKECPQTENGKYTDFKIAPDNRDIHFEIYRPIASKIRELKDKREREWITTSKGKLPIISYSLSFENIKAIVSLYIKEKKRKRQLPKNEPNFLILDLSRRFPESIHIADLISFENLSQSLGETAIISSSYIGNLELPIEIYEYAFSKDQFPIARRIEMMRNIQYILGFSSPLQKYWRNIQYILLMSCCTSLFY